jgi:hypothetical protein
VFDEGTKIALFAVVLTAWVFGLTTEQLAPRADLETAVETARLPPLPQAVTPDGAPAQSRVSGIRVDLSDTFTAELLATYVIEGLVVTRREFRNDPTSAISPLDLGIVWGDLAKPGGIDGFEFRTGHRLIWYSPPENTEMPRRWKNQVTNNHLIPANQTVSDVLMEAKVGSHVRLRGYLVKVTGDQISPWRSSLRRDDGSIVGGCEIILVTDVDILEDDQSAA